MSGTNSGPGAEPHRGDAQPTGERVGQWGVIRVGVSHHHEPNREVGELGLDGLPMRGFDRARVDDHRLAL